MSKKKAKRFAKKSLIKNVIILLVLFVVLFYLYRSCTSGYQKYAFFIHVKDESIFDAKIDPSDGRIIDKGRRLKDDILKMDRNVDTGNGANQGIVRWYDCSGIDCDEGWEHSFLPGD